MKLYAFFLKLFLEINSLPHRENIYGIFQKWLFICLHILFMELKHYQTENTEIFLPSMTLHVFLYEVAEFESTVTQITEVCNLPSKAFMWVVWWSWSSCVIFFWAPEIARFFFCPRGCVILFFWPERLRHFFSGTRGCMVFFALEIAWFFLGQRGCMIFFWPERLCDFFWP